MATMYNGWRKPKNHMQLVMQHRPQPCRYVRSLKLAGVEEPREKRKYGETILRRDFLSLITFLQYYRENSTIASTMSLYKKIRTMWLVLPEVRGIEDQVSGEWDEDKRPTEHYDNRLSSKKKEFPRLTAILIGRVKNLERLISPGDAQKYSSNILAYIVRCEQVDVAAQLLFLRSKGLRQLVALTKPLLWQIASIQLSGATSKWYWGYMHKRTTQVRRDGFGVTESNGTAIYHAVEYGRVNLVKLLIQAAGEDLASLNIDHSYRFKRTPLHVAVIKGYSEIVSLLLERTPANPLALDSRGRTPLHIAAAYGHTEILNTLLMHPVASCAKLQKDKKDWTPLHCAVYSGHVAAVELLLTHGCQVDQAQHSTHYFTDGRQFLLGEIIHQREITAALQRAAAAATA